MPTVLIAAPSNIITEAESGEIKKKTETNESLSKEDR